MEPDYLATLDRMLAISDGNLCIYPLSEVCHRFLVAVLSPRPGLLTAVRAPEVRLDA